ncbi:hypothetical protein [Flavitalea sp.]|nr:hypothetical protein [Flavitalea sp.]
MGKEQKADSSQSRRCGTNQRHQEPLRIQCGVLPYNVGTETGGRSRMPFSRYEEGSGEEAEEIALPFAGRTLPLQPEL